MELIFNKVCLASQSPRRRELLQQIGVHFDVLPANIDESMLPQENAEDYVQRITQMKAQAIWWQTDYHRACPVIASDTAVVVDDRILGKPENKNDAMNMLSLLSGRSHLVLSGVCLLFKDKVAYRLSSSEVTFCQLSEQDKRNYWLTGEGKDKAGGYAVQGFAASFISHISGSFSGIMGLPLKETCDLLNEFNVEYWLNAPANCSNEMGES